MTNKEVFERAQRDPVWWARNVLGVDPWSKQQEIMESVRDNPRTAVASCHGIGKTWVAAVIVLWFLMTHPNSIVITTAPTDRQVEGLLWKEIRSLFKRSLVTLANPNCLTKKKLELDEDWYAWGFTAPDYDPDRFQGFHARHILVVVDEAAGVSDLIFEGIEGVLSTAGAKILEIGNPTDGSCQFAKDHASSYFQDFSVSAYDTPNLTTFGITEEHIADGTWIDLISDKEMPAPHLVSPEWVARAYHRWGPASPFYLSRVKGEFPEETDDVLIPMRWVQAAMERHIEATGPIWLGVDVARMGTDETACYGNQGGRIRQQFISRKEKTTTTTGRVVKAVEKTTAKRVNVDVVGIGAGVYDALDEKYNEDPMQEIVVTPINFGGKPQDPERFANLKAELFWLEREAYERGERDIDPDDDMFAAQASSIKWKVNSKGKIQIESKEEAKRRGVPSPDRFEAAAYAGAEPVEEEEWSFSVGNY